VKLAVGKEGLPPLPATAPPTVVFKNKQSRCLLLLLRKSWRFAGSGGKPSFPTVRFTRLFSLVRFTRLDSLVSFTRLFSPVKFTTLLTGQRKCSLAMGNSDRMRLNLISCATVPKSKIQALN
jgi:hypothetical protein